MSEFTGHGESRAILFVGAIFRTRRSGVGKFQSGRGRQAKAGRKSSGAAKRVRSEPPASGASGGICGLAFGHLVLIIVHPGPGRAEDRAAPLKPARRCSRSTPSLLPSVA
jgi:hypothetical protein